MDNEHVKTGISHNYIIFIKGFIIELLVTALFIGIFALIMFAIENGYKYAPVFGTLSIAVGSLIASIYSGRKIGSKGLLIGFIFGAITFVVITIISLIIDRGGLTFNTLFHLIIIMLSSLVGGVIGVNRFNNRKYI